MYKKRFAAWKLRKYSTRASKHTKMKDCKPGTPETSSGSSLGGTESSSSTSSTQHATPPSGDDDGVTNIGDGAGIPHINPQDASSFAIYGPELLLRETGRYYSWFFHQNPPDLDFGYTLAASNVFDNLTNGRSMLSSDPHQGFALINKACSYLPELLRHPHLRMINHLVYHCADSGLWDGHAEARRLLVCYIYAKAYHVLGQEHPLFRIVSLLLKEFNYAEVRSNCIKQLLNVTNENMQPSTKALLSAQLETSTDYIRLKQWDSAERLVSQIIDRALECGADTEDVLCHAQYVLGTVYFRQGRYDDAHSQWLKVIELSYPTETRTAYPAFYMMSCRRLGELAEVKGSPSEAEQWVRVAIQRSLHIWGADDPATMRHLKCLERILVKMGKHEAVTNLAQEYGRVYESLSGFRLEPLSML